MITVAPAAPSTREADWRYLLPQAAGGTFEHLVVVGGSDQLEASLVDLGVARTVSRVLRPGEAADALIVLADAAELPEEALEQLAPGGVLYWEVDRGRRGRRLLTPRRAQRLLTKRGLTTTGAYWVKPGFPQRNMYLPLGAAGVFRWYVETLYRSTTRRRRVLKTALRALSSNDAALAACAPSYAVTAVRGPARRPAIVDRAADAVATPRAADAVFLAHGAAEWNRIVVLLFEPGSRVPAAAIKLPRTGALNPHVEHEHRILLDLALGVPAAMRRSIPESTLLQWNDLAVAVETCVTGSSLSSRIGRGTRVLLDDLRCASAWLTAFHAATPERVPAREWLNRHLVDGLCAEYSAMFGLTSDEAGLFDALSAAVEAASTETLPLVWQHTDFGPWNVYRDEDEIRVIDWEVARRGPALVDLLYFATHWSAAAAGCEDEQRRIAHAETLFCTGPRDEVGRGVHRAIVAYMTRVGIHASLFAPLLVYAFVEQAIDYARRLAAVGSSNVPVRDGNVYVGHLGALAMHRDRFFQKEHASWLLSCCSQT